MSNDDINYIKQYIILYHITVSNEYLPRFNYPAPYLHGWIELINQLFFLLSTHTHYPFWHKNQALFIKQMWPLLPSPFDYNRSMDHNSHTSKVWVEITYLFLNFNGAKIDVLGMDN